MVCTNTFPAINATFNNGSLPLKNSTVAMLDWFDINNTLASTVPASCGGVSSCSDACYVLKTNGVNGFTGTTGYYTTGNCQFDILANSYNVTSCSPSAPTCGAASFVLIDAALFIDNMFATLDYNLDPILNKILAVTVDAGGNITGPGTIGTNFGAAAQITDVAPFIKSTVDNHISNNSHINMDLSVFKALFGV
jgi:hypothetical protein